MEDFADRTINELMESYPLFLDALKEEYDVLMNILDIIFSSCSMMSKTEKPGWRKTIITCEVFDCFFEYQIYKIMEKYKYYDKIKFQALIIEGLYKNINYWNLNLNYRPKLELPSSRVIFELCICYSPHELTIEIHDTRHTIKVEEKYEQDMLKLFNNYWRS